MKKSDIDKIYREYHSQKQLYERFCSEVVNQLNELIASAAISPALPIHYRVKTWNSILQKIERKEYTIGSLNEIPDIAGIRIVLLFQRDMVNIADIIEDTLKILNKENTADRLGESEFGYGSIHFEVAAPDEWLKVPTLRPIGGILGEIQVRTAAQHIWAAASHILQYKKESDVPLPLRRTITRVAALLETVDLEFERVLAERDEYTTDINTEDKDETLNTDTLKKSLNTFLPGQNLSENESYSELLLELHHFNITKIGNLKSLINETWERALKEEAEYVKRKKAKLEETGEFEGTSIDRINKGVYFTHVGLIRQALREKFGDNKLDQYWRDKRKRK